MLRKKHYRSIEELQADLDRWLAWYNTERPHQGRHNRGRPPWRPFLFDGEVRISAQPELSTFHIVTTPTALQQAFCDRV